MTILGWSLHCYNAKVLDQLILWAPRIIPDLLKIVMYAERFAAFVQPHRALQAARMTVLITAKIG